MKKIAQIIKHIVLLPFALMFGIPDGAAPDDGGQTQTGTTQSTAQQSASSSGSQSTANDDEIFAKLDVILEQRLARVAKSALKDNGIAEDEVPGIVDAYRADKQRRADAQSQQMSALQNENTQLKAQIAASKLQAAATAAAAEMGVDAATVPYVVRLAEMGDALDDNGEPDKEKVSAALKKVLEDIPALKSAARDTSSGFVTVGASGGSGSPVSDAETRLRKAFGLK